MKLSFKVKTAAMTTLLIAVVAALGVAGILLMSKSAANSQTQQELIKTVERNVDEIEYKNGILEIEDDFAFFAGGVYCDVYSEDFARIDGETPAGLLTNEKFNLGKPEKHEIDGAKYYIYDTRLDFIKYEYEVDVLSGKIVKYEADVAESEALVAADYEAIRFEGGISSDEAVEIALEHAGVASDEAKIIGVELPAYSDRRVFSVSFTCEKKLYPSVWIRGIYPADTVENAFGTMERVILYSVPLFLILSALGAYMLARRTIRPVEEITRSANRISTGNDLSKRIAVPDASTEMRELTLTFNEMLERLEKSFETEKRFTSDASHELRTPLAVIKAECEYALGENADTDDKEEALVSISEQSEKMNALVNALLAVSRAEQGRIKPESGDLGETVEKICLTYPTDRGITVECEAEKGIILSFDKILIERMLENLLSNSLRYGRDGGKTLVTLKRENGNAVLTVRDNGVGIAEKDIDKIWERFYRADASRSGEGFGLGLPLVKQIVLLHSGKIGVRSVLGEGTEFEITIPITAD